MLASFRRYFLFAIVSLPLLFSGCATDYVAYPSDMAYSAQDSYMRSRKQLDSANVVAMLSYMSMYVGGKRVTSWDEMYKTMDAYVQNVAQTGMISVNYPVAPGRYDLEWMREFVIIYRREARFIYGAYNRGHADFPNFVANVIFRISNIEYDKDR